MGHDGVLLPISRVPPPNALVNPMWPTRPSKARYSAASQPFRNLQPAGSSRVEGRWRSRTGTSSSGSEARHRESRPCTPVQRARPGRRKGSHRRRRRLGQTEPAAHPVAQRQDGARLPALRPGHECNGRSPRHRAEGGARRRPTKGGAMRTRIALAAAMAAALISIMTTTSLTLVSTAGSATTGPLVTGSTTSAKPATPVAGGRTGSSLSTAAELSMSNALHTVDEATSTTGSGASSSTSTAPATTSTTAAPVTTPTEAVAAVRNPPATTTASTAPSSAPATPPPVTDATSTATSDWQCIRLHESGDRYNSAAAPSGAYGILAVTWHSFGQSGWPYQAPAATQDTVALELYHRYGWAPWGTRFVCGL